MLLVSGKVPDKDIGRQTSERNFKPKITAVGYADFNLHTLFTFLNRVLKAYILNNACFLLMWILFGMVLNYVCL